MIYYYYVKNKYKDRWQDKENGENGTIAALPITGFVRY